MEKVQLRLVTIVFIVIALVSFIYKFWSESSATWYVLAHVNYPLGATKKIVPGVGGIKAIYILKPHVEVNSNPELWRSNDYYWKICDLSNPPEIKYETEFIVAIEVFVTKPYINELKPENIKVEFRSEVLSPKILAENKTYPQFSWYAITENTIYVVAIWGTADNPYVLPVGEFFAYEAKVYAFGKPPHF